MLIGNNGIRGTESTTSEGTLVTYSLVNQGLNNNWYRVGFMIWGSYFNVSIKKIWLEKV